MQKEQEEGKMNLVLLHLKENRDASIDDSIAEVKRFLDEKRKELLKHVFTDDNSEFPNQWNHLHLSCFKVFQMLFNSDNLYDSDFELQSDIEKAIYIPPKYEFPKKLKPVTTLHQLPEILNLIDRGGKARIPLRIYCHGRMTIRVHQLHNISMRNVRSNVYSPMFSLCFI